VKKETALKYTRVLSYTGDKQITLQKNQFSVTMAIIADYAAKPYDEFSFSFL